MTITATITTHNRAADLAVTLAALARLDPPVDEAIVTLDGCTDGSSALLRSRFPDVHVIENPRPAGSVPSRDRMLRVATSELVLSLDDDSYPVERDFFARAAALFSNPRLAIATFPQRSDEFPATLDQADFGRDHMVGSYPNSGAMLRRSTYLSLPGYPPFFRHAFEEPDYALQCIAAGWEVRLHSKLTIRHHYSGQNRNERRTHHQHARNELWSVLLRCPAPWWPFVLSRRLAGQFLYACRRGPEWAVREPVWWWAAAKGARNTWRHRQPVSWPAYKRWRRMVRSPEPLSN